MNSKENFPFVEKYCLNSKVFLLLFLLLKILLRLNSLKIHPSLMKLNCLKYFSLKEKIFIFFPSFVLSFGHFEHFVEFKLKS